MAAADVVGNLVAEIEGEIDALVPRIGDRIREEIPDFRRLPAETLARAIRGNVTRALTALRDLRPPTDAELEQAAAIGREQAREEQQRRDAFLLALLTGTLEAAELRRESATFGVDPDRIYVPFRARALEPGAAPHKIGAVSGLVMALDRDLAGIATTPPPALPRLVVGLGPAVRLEALPAAFAMASRALQTAVAFGKEGAFTLADLSIRPAIVADEVLGDAFAARYLEPLAGLGRLGAELEETLRTWLDQGMRVDETARVLHVHPNTLRHRLRRFEETTGTTLRDPRHLVELWWALERRRLTPAPRRPAPG